MTETKQFATKRQRVAESPRYASLASSPSGFERGDPLLRLPIDLLAETLTFLSVLEIGPKIPSIQGASEGVDFSEAFKRATKRATQLKFDEEWNHHLEHEADGAFLAAHMSHKYRPDNVRHLSSQSGGFDNGVAHFRSRRSSSTIAPMRFVSSLCGSSSVSFLP